MKIALFLFMILITCSVNAQIFNIDTIEVSYVISEMNYEELGNHELGPSLFISMSIINDTDTTVVLQPSKSTLFLGYSYKGQNYFEEAATGFLIIDIP